MAEENGDVDHSYNVLRGLNNMRDIPKEMDSNNSDKTSIGKCK